MFKKDIYLRMYKVITVSFCEVVLSADSNRSLQGFALVSQVDTILPVSNTKFLSAVIESFQERIFRILDRILLSFLMGLQANK